MCNSLHMKNFAIVSMAGTSTHDFPWPEDLKSLIHNPLKSPNFRNFTL